MVGLLIDVLALPGALSTGLDELVAAELVAGFTVDVAGASLEVVGLMDALEVVGLVDELVGLIDVLEDVGLVDELVDLMDVLAVTGLVDELVENLLVLVGLMEVTTGFVLDEGAAADEDEATGAVALEATPDTDDAPPGPETLVVISPLSMYTPEKCQSSAAVSLRPVEDGSLSTPRCQSAPLNDALTDTGGTVSVRSSLPVEW